MAGSPQFGRIYGPDESANRVQDNVGAQFQPVAKALAATPIMGAPAPAWIAMSLVGGFANAGTIYATAAYHKDALGYVHVKGTLVNAAGAAAGVVISTLPGGYRPLQYLRFAVLGQAGAFNAVTVSNDGRLWTEVALAAGSAVDITLSFLAEQ